MQHTIHPCFWFDGNAQEAARFYTGLFPQSNIISANGLVVLFELHGQKFMGLNGGPAYSLNPSISLFVTSESNDEIDGLWSQLIIGGKVLMDLSAYEWSEYYGFLQDRFGVAWQLYKGNYSGVNQKITTSLMFTQNQFGKAKEALTFYTSLFPNSTIQGILEYSPEENQAAGTVKHAQFVLDNVVFMAMDGPGDHAFCFNEAFSLVVPCDTQQEIDHFWEKLSAPPGRESMCGWLVDPFGVSWQIVPRALGNWLEDPGRGKQVMEALLKMKKLYISVLQNA